jgi:hypothetical protein
MERMDLARGLPELSDFCSEGPEREGDARAQLLGADDPERFGLQHFIADSYFRTYGARVDHFADHLLGLRRANGPWLAGVGYTLVAAEPLFIEQYLDAPVETEMARRLGTPVRRDQIVEVGNLAATEPGAARRVIICMTALLNQVERTWVVFTSTRSLLNSFTRLEIPTIVLARADATRLPDRGTRWGSYYDTDPHVMTANIPLGFVHLVSKRRSGNGH